MWNSGGGFDGGFGDGGNDGGFMSTQAQFASPAGQVEKKARRQQNLIPVTLRSIVNCTDETMKVSNTEVHIVSVVGLIKAVDVTSTKITYTVDDTSAQMEAVQWVETEQETKDTMMKPLMEMTYCQIFGSLRMQQGKRYIMIFRIVPVEDPNIITTHMLEVIHTVMKLQKIETMQSSGATSGGINGSMQNSFIGATGLDGTSGNTSMASGGFSGNDGMDPTQRMVFQVIRQVTHETGIERQLIYQQLQGKVSHDQINKVLEFLSSEGHIYSTVDEDHFRTTDG